MAAKEAEGNNAKARAREAARLSIQQAATPSPIDLADSIKRGHREALAQAITLVESNHPDHQSQIEELLAHAKPINPSLRIGITGIPGAGKSTLIERFGLHAISQGWKVAVLAVDPSSQRTSGALLGDKTRMNDLSKHPSAFVRPSSAANTLGGVTRATSEAIQLVEAAGYDLVLVETVGVGQSETTVRNMVDIFVLMLIGGAGDDVQGMKRGVVEMADVLVIHKAEDHRLAECRATANAYSQALHLLPTPPSGSQPNVHLVSSHTGAGHAALWAELLALRESWEANGWWKRQRRNQRLDAMLRHAKELLVESQMRSKSKEWHELQEAVKRGEVSPFGAARTWVHLPESEGT